MSVRELRKISNNVFNYVESILFLSIGIPVLLVVGFIFGAFEGVCDRYYRMYKNIKTNGWWF